MCRARSIPTASSISAQGGNSVSSTPAASAVWHSTAFRKKDSASPGFTGPGKEPLRISKAEFRELFHRRRTSIKAALLNQKLLHGVGNIYADESLFRAGIRPRRMARSLKRAELDRLHRRAADSAREAIRSAAPLFPIMSMLQA